MQHRSSVADGANMGGTRRQLSSVSSLDGSGADAVDGVSVSVVPLIVSRSTLLE